MLSKILLTSAVIVVAFFVVRQRAVSEASETQSASGTEAADRQDSGELRFMAYAFLAMVIGLAVTMYYFQWRDDHTVLTITLYPDNQASPSSYQVYKYQLGERSFTTIDGINITVASSERMEIEGLNE